MAPVLNIRVFRLDERGSGSLQQNRPYSLEVGSVSLGRQGNCRIAGGKKQGRPPKVLVIEIVMCPQ